MCLHFAQKQIFFGLIKWHGKNSRHKNVQTNKQTNNKTEKEKRERKRKSLNESVGFGVLAFSFAILDVSFARCKNKTIPRNVIYLYVLLNGRQQHIYTKILLPVSTSLLRSAIFIQYFKSNFVSYHQTKLLN